MSGFVPRPIVEPGGILLVGVGLSDADLLAAIDKLYGESSSLTILISRPQQARLSLPADEVWVYAALGLRGAMALVRRISWRHFEAVHQPSREALGALRFFVWPRPIWRLGSKSASG